MTLSHFTESDIVENTSLIFAAGHHTLNEGVSLSNIDNLLMLVADNDSVSITCADSVYFNLTSIDLVHISNLTFVACGNNSIKSVKLQ